MGILDAFSGEAKKDFIEIAQKAHQDAYPARDMNKEAGRLYHQLAAEEKYVDKFKEAIKGHLSDKAGKSQTKALHAIKAILDALKLSLRDEAIIAHLVLHTLGELIEEDKRIESQGFPEDRAEALVKETEEELVAVKKQLWSYGNVFRQLATEK
jgi:hypothetical protein